MRSVGPAVLVGAILLSGCLGASAPSQAPDLDRTSQPVSYFSSAGFARSFTGEDANWTVLFLPFAGDTGSVSVEYVVRVTAAAAGGAARALVMAPTLVTRDGFIIFPDIEYRQATDGRPVNIVSERRFAAATSGTFVGLLFAMAATGPWTADVNITGPDFDAAAVYEADGPTAFQSWDVIVSPAGMATPLVGAGVPGVDLAAPGWTHVALDEDRVQPVGVRYLEVKFPNGATASGTGYGYGASTPILCFSSRSGKTDFWGSPADKPGRLEATMAYADAVLEARLVVVSASMPPEAWPASVRAGGSYSGYGWPC
jgi:hypothetical protein